MRYKKPVIIGLSALTIAYGAYKMNKSEYSKRICKEIPRLIYDWCIDKNPEINANKLYMDLHFHFNMPEDIKGLENIVEKAMKKVDVIAVTGRGKKKEQSKGKRKLLYYNDFKEMLADSEKYKLGIEDKGRLTIVKNNNDLLYVIKGQEILTDDGREVLALGCEKDFYEKEGTIKTIKEINNNEGISIIVHPYTISTKKAPYFMLANKKEEEELEEISKEADAVEAFNADNTLWMFPSNVKAEMFSEQYGIPGVSFTDGHGILNLLGNSRIIINKGNIGTMNGNSFISSLKDVIKTGNFQRHTEYNDPINFIKSHADFIERRMNKVMRKK